MATQKPTEIRRLINAACHSLNGLKSAWTSEAAFRLEVIVGILLIPAGFVLGQSAVERSLLIGTCLLVLITEILNSAIEAAIDRISNDHHLLSGRAKDYGSAAVFLACFLTVIVWGLVLYERFGG